MRKVIIIVLLVVLVGAVVTGVSFAYKGNDTPNDTFYTDEDLQAAYDKGYKDAGMDKKTVNKIVSEHDNLVNQKNSLASDVARLTATRDSLLSENASLQQSIVDKDGIIADNLSLIEQNNAIIENLNEQIAAKQALIDNFDNQLLINELMIIQLNATVSSLQSDIEAYRAYLNGSYDPNLATVIFEFGGKVYALKSVPKGETVFIENPQSTEFLIFNGWTLNGEPVNLSTYTVTENVRIIADETRKYAVNFVVDDVITSTQIIEEGQHVTAPANPSKADYSFEYWTTESGNQINFDELSITSNITFVAKFVRLYNVSFVYEGITLNTQSVKEHAFATPYGVNSTDRKVFNGWTVGGSAVNVYTYEIITDTVFVANITYKSKVDFISRYDDNPEVVVSSQFVENGTCPNAPTVPVASFVGWTLENNLDVLVDTSNYAVTQDTVFIAKFEHWQRKNISNGVVLSNGSAANKTFTLNITGLKTTDTFKVVFSTMTIEDTDNASCLTWYWSTSGQFDYCQGIYGSRDTGEKTSYELNNNSFPKLQTVSTVGWVGTIKVECLTDGVLTITVTTNNSYITWHDLTIDYIEVYVD